MPRLLVCGWEGADWKLLNPLIDAGAMPNLAALIEGGAMGELHHPPPFVPALAWTTLATGVPPERHRILTQAEADPLSGGLRPIGVSSRRTPAIWGMLSDAGLDVQVVGWPATHPAEQTTGTVVSNCFATAPADPDASWPVPPGTLRPEHLEPDLADLRVHPGDLTGDDLAWFVPRLGEIDQRHDTRLLPLAHALAEAITYHGAATWLEEHEPWDLLAVYYALPGRLAHHYLRYTPPALEGVAPRERELFGGVVEAGYRFLDMLLGRLLELAGRETQVMIVSPQGYLAGDGRPARVSGAGPDYWPRQQGIICLAGPGIRRDALIFGARALDVTPTILATFGLPARMDMPGRVLAEAFAETPSTERAAAWEGEEAEDDGSADEALDELAALGYQDPLAERVREQAAQCEADARTHLAFSHLAAGLGAEAMELLEAIGKAQPEAYWWRPYLAYACLLAGRLEECRRTLDALPGGGRGDPVAGLVAGCLLFEEGQSEKALGWLREMEQEGRAHPASLCITGEIYRRAGHTAEAARCYLAALGRDSGLAAAHLGLARLHLAAREARKALEEALAAVGASYELAPAHLALGTALAMLGLEREAAAAFANCARLDPENRAARRWLKRWARRGGGE